MLSIVQDVEGTITSLIEKEIEKRKKAIEDKYDKEMELLQKAKDAYNRENEEEDYSREYDKQRQKIQEIQQAISLASRDMSLSGQKALADLQKQLQEEMEKLEEMEREQNRQNQNDWFDDEMDRLEQEKDDAIKEMEDTFDEKYIANMVAELLKNGFTELGNETIKLSDLMADHFEDRFSLIGDSLQSNFLDKLGEAKEIASAIDEIFKGMGVNLDPNSRPTTGTYYPSSYSASTLSTENIAKAVKQATMLVRNDLLSSMNKVSGATYSNNNSVNVGSLLNIHGSVDKTVMPRLEDIVNQAVNKLQDNLRKQYRGRTGLI